jgi:hypothetical protein
MGIGSMREGGVPAWGGASGEWELFWISNFRFQIGRTSGRALAVDDWGARQGNENLARTSAVVLCVVRVGLWNYFHEEVAIEGQDRSALCYPSSVHGGLNGTTREYGLFRWKSAPRLR